MYEGLRRLLRDVEKEDPDGSLSALEGLDLTFSIVLRKEEGGGTVDLIPNGSSVKVTRGNFHEYVRRYAEYRMLSITWKPLMVRYSIRLFLPELPCMPTSLNVFVV